jgi:hypothetical protein
VAWPGSSSRDQKMASTKGVALCDDSDSLHRQRWKTLCRQLVELIASECSADTCESWASGVFCGQSCQRSAMDFDVWFGTVEWTIDVVVYRNPTAIDLASMSESL